MRGTDGMCLAYFHYSLSPSFAHAGVVAAAMHENVRNLTGDTEFKDPEQMA